MPGGGYTSGLVASTRTASATAARRATRTAISRGRSASRRAAGRRGRERAAGLVDRRRGRGSPRPRRRAAAPAAPGRACPAGQSVAGRARRDAAISSRTPGRCRATPRSVSTDADWRTWSRRSRSACDSATNSGGPRLRHAVDGPADDAVGDRRGHHAQPDVGEEHALARRGGLAAEQARPGEAADVAGCGQHEPRGAAGRSPPQGRHQERQRAHRGARRRQGGGGGGGVVGRLDVVRVGPRRERVEDVVGGRGSDEPRRGPHGERRGGAGHAVRLGHDGRDGSACRALAGHHRRSRRSACRSPVAAASGGTEHRLCEARTTGVCSRPTAPAGSPARRSRRCPPRPGWWSRTRRAGSAAPSSPSTSVR